MFHHCAASSLLNSISAQTTLSAVFFFQVPFNAAPGSTIQFQVPDAAPVMMANSTGAEAVRRDQALLRESQANRDNDFEMIGIGERSSVASAPYQQPYQAPVQTRQPGVADRSSRVSGCRRVVVFDMVVCGGSLRNKEMLWFSSRRIKGSLDRG